MMKRSLLLLVFAISFSGCGKDECEEKQSGGCVCTKEYNPVCGCNNKTYGNPCEAECNGIEKYTAGACK